MKTFLDWSAYKDAGVGDAYADIPKTGGDFAKAIAVCINSRQCERADHKGVMCPSFRITQQTENSTGGRVRLLKAALNGQLGELALQHPSVAQAMDACLGCKGCKRECENTVDMALIKMEYIAQHHAKNPISWRNYVLAHFPRLLQRYPFLSQLPALHNRLPWLAKLTEKWFGITARRSVPAPKSAPALNLTASSANESNARAVVLLVDTFTQHFNPEIAEAAISVLQAAGYQVNLAAPAADDAEAKRNLCCGRTFLAQGLIDEARLEARRMITALQPLVEAGQTIIGLEPSCLLTLRDEYKALGLGDAAAKIAQHSLLLEEFLAREHTAKKLNLKLKAIPQTVPALVQGHCHQHALGAIKAMRKVLKLIPNFQFEIIEPACCGMAGSFGIEAEHVEMSLEMAEQTLLPALRAAPDAQVIANGFSCRHQIHDTAHRTSQHLALVLRAALA